MKKVIIGLVLVVLLAVAAGIYYVLTNLDSLVKAAIEKYGTQATQTAVRVDKVHIDLTDGAGAIFGLRVANPAGFAKLPAFSLGEVGTRINIKSLTEEPYIIDEIVVRAPQVYVEINADKQINLNALKKNLTAGEPAAAAESGSKAAPRLIIRQIVFADGRIDAKVVPLDNKEYKLKLPNLNMRNLGGNNGATPQQLAKEIISRLSDQAMTEIKKQGIDAEVDKLKAKAREKADEEKAKLKDKADSKVEEEKQKMDEKLKNLLTK